jgi:carboxypeptidase T
LAVCVEHEHEQHGRAPVAVAAAEGEKVKARVLVAFLLMSLLAFAPAPARAAEPTMPAGYEAYHTYAEMEAFLGATVAAYPDIAHKFSIGKSHQGRDIWALKISDNVQLDEDEPEVVFDSLLHGNERLTGEMNLYLIRILTEEYGTNQRITSIVDNTEIFIIPMLNPDGAEYDISGDKFRGWRKNRQPNAGTTAVGTDPNRNFGYKWGCCGGSSGNPSSNTYRGPKAFSTPEARAYRDFVNSRVVNDRQQIRLAVTWHAAGEYILWPYGYTQTKVPRTMSADDRTAMVAIAKEMAVRNGYRAKQSSAFYVTDGDQIDWLYGEHRIFAYTIELYPRSGGSDRHHPPPSVIERETKRNRGAVLYMLEQATCPYAAAGLGTTHCGPLNDDFETGRGWTVNPFGSDTATKGMWQRAVPKKTKNKAGVKQRKATPSGRMNLVTGAAGGKPNANDVDGGVTSVASPPFHLEAGGEWRVSLRYYFAHNKKATNVDYFRVSVVHNGSRTTLFEQRGAAVHRNANYSTVTRSLSAFAGQTVRLLIEAADNGADSLIEAAVDDVRVYRPETGAGSIPLSWLSKPHLGLL